MSSCHSWSENVWLNTSPGIISGLLGLSSVVSGGIGSLSGLDGVGELLEVSIVVDVLNLGLVEGDGGNGGKGANQKGESHLYYLSKLIIKTNNLS